MYQFQSGNLSPNQIVEIRKSLGISTKEDVLNLLKNILPGIINTILSERIDEIANKTLDLIPIPSDGMKGDTGEIGPMGPQGLQGESGKSIQGPQGPMGPQGPRGEPGQSIQGPQGEPGKSIQGPIGKNGKDGSSDKPAEIARKLETLKGEEQLDYNLLKNRPNIEALKGRLGKKMGGGGTTLIGPIALTGAINDSNTIFTIPSQYPLPADGRVFAIINGKIEMENVNFTRSVRTITMSTAPSLGSEVIYVFYVV